MPTQKATILFEYNARRVTISKRGHSRQHDVSRMTESTAERLARFIDRDDVRAVSWARGTATLAVWLS